MQWSAAEHQLQGALGRRRGRLICFLSASLFTSYDFSRNLVTMRAVVTGVPIPTREFAIATSDYEYGVSTIKLSPVTTTTITHILIFTRTNVDAYIMETNLDS